MGRRNRYFYCNCCGTGGNGKAAPDRPHDPTIGNPQLMRVPKLMRGLWFCPNCHHGWICKRKEGVVEYKYLGAITAEEYVKRGKNG